MQEFVPLGPITAFAGPDDALISDWEALILKTINDNKEGAKYVKLEDKTMMGLCTLLFCKKTDIANIRCILSDRIKLGFQGVVGNKGGVAISFSYYDTSFCVMNCHLTHGQKEFKERFEQLKELYKGRIIQGQHYVDVKDHDRIFMLGDLNFRISMENQECREKAMAKQVEELAKYDQFWANYGKELGSEDDPKLLEGKIRFLPTYKYDLGTSEFDTSSKRRPPAWCDRILWIKTEKDNIICTKYDSIMSMSYSDHKPLLGIYEVKVVKEDHELKEEVEKTIIYELNEEKILSLHSVNDAEPKAQSPPKFLKTNI